MTEPTMPDEEPDVEPVPGGYTPPEGPCEEEDVG